MEPPVPPSVVVSSLQEALEKVKEVGFPAILRPAFSLGLLSRSEYDDWKSRYDKELSQYQALKSQHERVEKLVEYCTIKSQTKGVVKKLFVREGMFVNGTLSPEVLLILEER